ncbi:hypothetical protein AM1_C0157 (plasmid) [Acaryochloris marina MBIC11017]|uniref:Uncharacterized protein n=1 Tax=Acaryochloris marina (strain MBIC 11017) TaxID=329726 RepID=A8ZMQ1_ACAM1|nr:hypothetical protein AM1_C0157 [Acaryochloris marina MBIC11017]
MSKLNKTSSRVLLFKLAVILFAILVRVANNGYQKSALFV